MTLDAFLQTIIADPLNAGPVWLVLADWLEDQDDPRFELVRILHQPDYRRNWTSKQRDERVCELLESGMQPVVPTIENSIDMRFALIPAGTFRMGSPGDYDNKHTHHEVEITRLFWMGVYPVTQEQYQGVTGNNPSWFSASGGGKDKVEKRDTTSLPVEQVSWDDAVAFCEKLSKLPKERKAGRGYRLPTEAEWEYACRGGAACPVPSYFGDTNTATQNLFHGSIREPPWPVGHSPANRFGLHDMHDNIWEWCLDWFDEYSPPSSPLRDPQGPVAGIAHVVRGSSWEYDPRGSIPANRYSLDAGHRDNFVGFRLCFRLDL
jgi:uncharacterized protein (TIGR02996 family)